MTHLVAGRCRGIKYRDAVALDKPILRREWIDFLWENRDSSDFDIRKDKGGTLVSGVPSVLLLYNMVQMSNIITPNFMCHCFLGALQSSCVLWCEDSSGWI